MLNNIKQLIKQKIFKSDAKAIAWYKDIFIRLLEQTLAIVFFIGLALFIIFVVRDIDLGFLKGEVITYPVACNEPTDWKADNTNTPNKQTTASSNNENDPLGLFGNSFAPNSIRAKDRVIYKPLATTQQVISYTEDNNALTTYKNCSVKDINNWTCTIENDIKLGSINGKVFNSSYTNNTCNFLVTKPKWLDLKCRENQTDIKMKIICGISNIWEVSSKDLSTNSQPEKTTSSGWVGTGDWE